MKLLSNAAERAQIARVVGIVLVLAAPGMAFGTLYSTRQPLEVLALAERMKATLPPDHYSSAVYHGSYAQETLDNKWKPTGFATMGTAGFLLGAGLLITGLRRREKAA